MFLFLKASKNILFLFFKNLEQGETIEEAVAREVVEESGIKIGKKITYIGSQPWPYPSQLMIGCLAEAETETITIDEVIVLKKFRL